MIELDLASCMPFKPPHPPCQLSAVSTFHHFSPFTHVFALLDARLVLEHSNSNPKG
jgi:hypothetical protein